MVKNTNKLYFIEISIILIFAVSVPPLAIAAIVGFATSARSKIFFTELISYLISIKNIAEERNNIFIDRVFGNPEKKIKLAILSICILIVWFLLIFHLRKENTENFVWFVLTQIFLTLLLAIFTLGLAWTVFSAEKFFSSIFVSSSITLLVSTCFIFSNLLAIEFFSKNFPFSPSNLPVAYGIGVVMLAFAFTSIIFSAIAIAFEVIMLFSVARKKTENYSAFLFYTFLIFVVGFLSSYTASIAAFQGLTPKGQLLMIKLAQNYDFTSNHLCATKEGESILFVGNVVDRAYAAKFPNPKYLPAHKVSEKDFKENLPRDFRMVRCNPLPSHPN